MKGQIAVFEGDIEAADIRQGSLGDCWFLSAVAALAEFPILVEDLFVNQSSKEFVEEGVYTLQFNKMGFWQSIRLDDFFSCFPGSGPICAKSNGNELWVMLLEKAYAKLHGSYEVCKSGRPHNALTDLTGAPTKVFSFDHDHVKPLIESGQLWRDICRYDKDSYLMAASTKTDHEAGFQGMGDDNHGGGRGHEPKGLVSDHSYTLISAVELKNGLKLLRLRNPWGHEEWSGAFSDNSPLWTDAIKDEIASILNLSAEEKELVFAVADDGAFWMCYEDFIKHYEGLCVCMVRHEGIHDQPWHVYRQRLQFTIKHHQTITTPASAASYHLEYQLMLLEVLEPATIVLSIHQRDERFENTPSYLHLEACLLKLSDTIQRVEDIKSEFQLQNVLRTAHEPRRQNSSHEVDILPGKYLILPCMLETDFITHLRQSQHQQQSAAGAHHATAAATAHHQHQPHAAAQKQHALPLTQIGVDGVTIEFSDEFLLFLTDLYQRIDINGDCSISLEEFSSEMEEQEAFAWIQTGIAEQVHVETLTLSTFVQTVWKLFDQLNHDEALLRKLISALGYTDHLLLQPQHRVASVVVHCTSSTCNLTNIPYAAASDNSHLHRMAHAAMRWEERKSTQQLENDQIIIYRSHNFAHTGVTLFVENKSPSQSLEMTMNVERSSNIFSCYSAHHSMSHTVVIPPGEYRAVHRLLPSDPSHSWSYHYDHHHEWIRALPIVDGEQWKEHKVPIVFHLLDHHFDKHEAAKVHPNASDGGPYTSGYHVQHAILQFELQSPAHVIATLAQHQSSKHPLLKCGVAIFLQQDEDNVVLIASSTVEEHRQLFTEDILLQPGKYLVLPRVVDISFVEQFMSLPSGHHAHKENVSRAVDVIVNVTSECNMIELDWLHHHTLIKHAYDAIAIHSAKEYHHQDHNKVVIYLTEPQEHDQGVTLLVGNKSPKNEILEFTMDCSKCKHLFSYWSGPVVTVTIAPDEVKVLHRLLPEVGDHGWSYSFTGSHKWIPQ